ncbi:MAG: FAD-binding protein [Proteobacteria bacterium]|nr:FAD-binding protein [Pseudomonadota bacterium]
MKGLAKDLGGLIGRQGVWSDPEDLYAYSTDMTHYLARGMPEAVVLPASTEETAKVMQYAFKHEVAVTPRGAGSGLSGGCTPLHGGIVLDMKRMRRILEINPGNMTAGMEAGVVLRQFHNAVERMGLFYPPDPQSQEVSTLGGNVATRAGGPRGVKYGTTPNYVLGLEVVLPDGSIIHTGASTVKYSVGYDLTHLMTGSEGTLGVITRVTVRLLPLPPTRRTAVAVFASLDEAATMVAEITVRGTVPAKLEFITQGGIQIMNSFLDPVLPLTGEAYLLIELDGTPAQVEEDAVRLEALCKEMKVLELRMVPDEKQAQTYWKARINLAPAILSIFKRMIIEDVTVPRDRIPDFVRWLQNLSASIGLVIGVGGHAGDGNMHPTIVLNDFSQENEKKAREAIEQIVKYGLSLGGTISGEHGIGFHKAPFLLWELGQTQIDLQRRIKQAFDPKGIMNPGKLWNYGGAA